MKKQWQQGDVVFHQEPIPTTKLERVAHHVIQEGEHTGHAHRIRIFRHGEQSASATACPQWEMFVDKNTNTKYLKVARPIEVDHEEHKTVTIPPGEYRIGIVQEYDHFAEEARLVQD